MQLKMLNIVLFALLIALFVSLLTLTGWTLVIISLGLMITIASITMAYVMDKEE